MTTNKEEMALGARTASWMNAASAIEMGWVQWGGDCRKCGATRVDQQIGLERTPEEYTAKMVAVFREVRRVLKPDGVLFLNLGDSYVANGSGQVPQTKQHIGSGFAGPNRNGTSGLKPKDLVGIPWRVAFALQADGWWLRSEIIWHKLNPMPESVKDRPTKAHEQIFLFTKSAKYYWDADAVKEPASPDSHARYARGRSDVHKWADGGPGDQTIAKSFEHMRSPGVNPKCAAPGSGIKQNSSFSAAVKDLVSERNTRSVWAIATRPYSAAHFATFPPEIPQRCIAAGSREGDTVLDPFGGAGTTGMVALRMGRRAILVDLSPEYVEMARERIIQDAPMFNREVA